MDLNDALLIKVRDQVERNTRRPAYMCDDEEWAVAFDEVLAAHPELSKPKPPVCPHCGSMAPYGDERNIWISAHLESRPHRLWWKLKAMGL